MRKLLKNLTKFVGLAVAVMIFGLFAQLARVSAQNIANYPNYSAYLSERDEFLSKVSDPAKNFATLNDFSDYVQIKGPALTQKIDNATSELRGTNINEDRIIADDLDTIKTSLAIYIDSTRSTDTTAIDTAGERLNQSFARESSTLQQLQATAQTDSNNSTTDVVVSIFSSVQFWLYLVLFVIAIAVSVSTYAWANNEPKITVKKLKNKSDAIAVAKQQKNALFRVSLWPVGGSVITLGWYMYAYYFGGLYLILWGPVLIGWFSYINAFRRYRADEASGAHEVRGEITTKMIKSKSSTFDIYVCSGRIRRLKKAQHAKLTINTAEKSLMIRYDDGKETVLAEKGITNYVLVGDIFTIAGKKGVGYWFSVKPMETKAGILKKMYFTDAEKQTFVEIDTALSLVKKKKARPNLAE